MMAREACREAFSKRILEEAKKRQRYCGYMHRFQRFSVSWKLS